MNGSTPAENLSNMELSELMDAAYTWSSKVDHRPYLDEVGRRTALKIQGLKGEISAARGLLEFLAIEVNCRHLTPEDLSELAKDTLATMNERREEP
jgi:hypothetical protein